MLALMCPAVGAWCRTPLSRAPPREADLRARCIVGVLAALALALLLLDLATLALGSLALDEGRRCP
eukprot:10286329-Heterocapsa_arctica.AAC.1